MPATLTTVDAILKEVYGPRLDSQLQNEVTALKRIERTSDGVTETAGGKYVDFPIRVSRNHGIGYRPEGGQLPAAGQQGYAEVHVTLKYGYGRVRFTGQLMVLADKNYQAFASAMDREMKFLKEDIMKDSARVVYGTGQGLIASITDTATSTTHTVDNPQYLEVDMKVDILVKTTGSPTGGLVNTTVTAVTGNSVTFAGSFTGALTLGIYRTGNYGFEPVGFSGAIGTGALFGLTHPKWESPVIANGGTPRALSEGLMIEVCDTVRRNGGKTSVIFTSLGVRRAYFNLLTQQRRYTDTKSFDGGFQGLAFNYGTEVPVVEDVDAPPNIMWFVDEDKFKIYRNKEWHWADDDGSVLKWVTDFDSWEGFMRQYWEIGLSSRNAQAKLADVIEG